MNFFLAGLIGIIISAVVIILGTILWLRGLEVFANELMEEMEKLDEKRGERP